MRYKVIFARFIEDFEKALNAAVSEGYTLKTFQVHETGYYAIVKKEEIGY